jgi:hypothetical protein
MTMIVKVKILRPLPGVFAEYQPEVGKIYDASYKPCKWNPGGSQHTSPVCVISVKDKKICLKTQEYEIVG